MSWLFRTSESPPPNRVEEANRAMSTIFYPSHAALPSTGGKALPAIKGSGDKERPQESCRHSFGGTRPLKSMHNESASKNKEALESAETRASHASSLPSRMWLKAWSLVTCSTPQSEDFLHSSNVKSGYIDPTSRTKSHTDSLTKTCTSRDKNLTTLTLDKLPDCPIAGYELDKKRGLVDIYSDPPRVLSARELRRMIIELCCIEQRTKNIVDYQFGPQLNSRGLRGMELLINPCILLTGLYFMTWRAARLWQSALPRKSFILNSCLKLVRYRLPAEEQERVARRHCRLMRATNTQVSLSFLLGAAMVIISSITWPSFDVMETAPEIVIGKQNVAYQQHSMFSLKWLWFVYYNHPAYASQAVSVMTPKLLQ